MRREELEGKLGITYTKVGIQNEKKCLKKNEYYFQIDELLERAERRTKMMKSKKHSGKGEIEYKAFLGKIFTFHGVIYSYEKIYEMGEG